MSTPKVTPLLMTRENVIAIREGRKTQTRRVVKLTEAGRVKASGSNKNWHPDDSEAFKASPYGQPGDRLALKQTWWGWGYWINDALGSHHKPQWRWVDETDADHPILFDADFAIGDKPAHYAVRRTDLSYHRRPSIYLPKDAWGPILGLTEVRVERLQDISEEDAQAEGCQRGFYDRDTPDGPERVRTSYRDGFQALWDSINGKQQPDKPDVSWKANPYVFALTFKPLS